MHLCCASYRYNSTRQRHSNNNNSKIIYKPLLFFRPPHPQQHPWQAGHLATGLGGIAVNSNLGGVHLQQQGHMQGHWHLPASGLSLQQVQHGFGTHAPNVTGKFRDGQQPQPPQSWGGSKPPQQLPQSAPTAWSPQQQQPQPHWRFSWTVHASSIMQHAKI